MATLYLHRLLVIVPVAKVAAVGGWWKANIDPVDDCTTWPALNPSGLATDPVTHRWGSMSLTDPNCKAVLVKLCQLASVAPPTGPQWAGWTLAQKRAWLLSVQAAILAGYGVYVTLSDNTGTWDAPAAGLAALGLQVQRTGP